MRTVTRRRPKPCPDCGIAGSHRRGCQVAACPTGKVRYPDEERARDALASTLLARVLRDDQRRRETRAYACRDCRGWHLTSTPDRQETR